MKFIKFVLILIIVAGGYYLYSTGKLNHPISLIKQVSTQIPGNNQGSSPTGSGKESKPPTLSNVNDFGPVGSLNHEILQSKTFKKLVVEIDYEANSRPKSSSTLFDKLKKYVDKPEGVVAAGSNSFNKTKDTYTLSDIQSLVKAQRASYTHDQTTAIYVLYLNGSYGPNVNALGLAINASTIVMFPDQMDEATTALVLGSTIESAVLTHELGHILGLVNLRYKSAIDHEDRSHPGHSNNSRSVMYWAVEDISITNILSGGPPSQFDSSDEQDIENIKAGAY